MNSKPRASNLSIALLALALFAGTAFPCSQEDRQQSLTARLSGGDEEQRLDAATQLVVLFGALPDSASPQTLAVLTRALRSDGSPVVRALAARAMQSCCADQAIEPLLAGLAGEKEIAVRKAILYALASHRSPQIVSALIPLLKDKKPEIRAVAAYALAEAGDASSASAMTEALRTRRNEEDAFTRSQIARGLGRIGERAAIDALLDALARDKSQEVRREAARALGLIANKQDAKVIEALRQMTLQPDPYLTSITIAALERIQSRDS